jgi:uncharacterized paraquat-inducible protein A
MHAQERLAAQDNEAMSRCPKCGGEMAARDVACPHCGYDFPEMPAQRAPGFAYSGLAYLVLAVGIVAVALGVILVGIALVAMPFMMRPFGAYVYVKTIIEFCMYLAVLVVLVRVYEMKPD